MEESEKKDAAHLTACPLQHEHLSKISLGGIGVSMMTSMGSRIHAIVNKVPHC